MRKALSRTPVVSMADAQKVLSPRRCRVEGERGFREGHTRRVVAAHHVRSGKGTISSRILVIQLDCPLGQSHRLRRVGRDILDEEEKPLKEVRLGEGAERRYKVSV